MVEDGRVLLCGDLDAVAKMLACRLTNEERLRLALTLLVASDDTTDD